MFPKEWSADKVVHTIGDIATSPDTKWFAQTGTGGIILPQGNLLAGLPGKSEVE